MAFAVKDKPLLSEYTDKGGSLRRLTPKQRKIAQLRVRKPYLTQGQMGKELGMQQPHVNRELVKPQVKDYIRELMNKSPKLRVTALLRKLEDGLDATELKSVRLEDSNIRPEVEVPDYAVRHKYLQDALKMQGALSNEDQQSVTGPINLAIILGGGGSELERQGVVDVLLAARISRNLHPTENRRMTDIEAKEYGRRSP